MGRIRTFAVEMSRREGRRTPADIWRRLVDAARLQAARANGEIFGVKTDAGGSEKWAITEFLSQVLHAPPAPLCEADPAHGLALALFRDAVRGFAGAGDNGRRRLFAPVLASSADLVEQLMDRAGVPVGSGRGDA